MIDAPPIHLNGLSKRFSKSVLALDNVSFEVQPGRVTGFLGPNGAGKTTSLRILLSLIAPTSGTALIGDRPYRTIPHPARVIGASLEANSFHPGRTARDHLLVHAQAAGIDGSRADEVLGVVGLAAAAKRRVGGFSLGMRQRLGLATALLGDPQVLVLDEPINGLDPEGIRWIRDLLRYLADEGRTVLISSHVLSEVEQTVDDVRIIVGGHLAFDGTLADLENRAGVETRVSSPTPEALAAGLAAAGLSAVPNQQPGVLVVEGATAAVVGHAAFVAGVELSALSDTRASLENVFLDVVRSSGAVEAAAPGSPDHARHAGTLGPAAEPEPSAAPSREEAGE